MFYDNFIVLCKKKSVAPTRVALDIGLSKSAPIKWRSGAIPNGDGLQKLADYFGVTTDYLLTGAETKKAPTLTKKDERDIARKLDEIMNDLENSGTLMFDGDPMSDEARESMRAAIKLGLEAAKLKNKERFTPKKYRKD